MKRKGSHDPSDKEFNWFLFLAQPAEDISLQALNKAELLASNWVTCACGQLCQALPRGTPNNPSEPKDPELSKLGYRFHDEIEAARYCKKRNEQESLYLHLVKAKETIIQIEKRTNQLLQNL
jgi:hypothetical protein